MPLSDRKTLVATSFPFELRRKGACCEFVCWITPFTTLFKLTIHTKNPEEFSTATQEEFSEKRRIHSTTAEQLNIPQRNSYPSDSLTA
jgi:hypothetical protein